MGNPKVSDTTDGTFSIAKCPVKPTADLNGDCRVDFADLAILAGEWLTRRFVTEHHEVTPKNREHPSRVPFAGCASPRNLWASGDARPT